ncbi:citryl-CoA lyase [Pigmentiphaga litoralis]|uniref:citryl-CoA lyase n=1 Tax=Pigmentiphaga litoralis TaxID=516702 RepID=UPI00167354DE|nr:citryl-CoA lyase [Pigmentiphaga litoralis]GGX01995.1 citryl-CoA lyase [Pigmentiphaga litoralis]
MQTGRTPMRSAMGRSDATTITVQGLDLCSEVLGTLNLGDFAFLEITGKRPHAHQSIVFNAMLATLVEHGMTPMVMAARLTYLGAPESLQAAVAAGLCGIGSTFAGTAEGAAKLLQAAYQAPGGAAGSAAEGASTSAEDTAPSEVTIADLAARIVAEHRAARRPIPGIGHNLHKPVDPRTTRLFDLAREHGLHGRYVALMNAISAEAERVAGKPGQLPVNATGALGALCCELAIPWQLCRGLAVIGRSIGIVGHLAEELRNPIARTLWERTEAETSGVDEASGGDQL